MTAETNEVLTQVREAKALVLTRLTDDTIPAGDKRILADVLFNLQEQADTLINFTLQAMVDKINASNSKLENLIVEMENTSEDISALSNTIKKISGLLSTFTQVTSKTLGLVGG